MKFAADRPWSDPEKAARKLLEIANNVEAVQGLRPEILTGTALGRPSHWRGLSGIRLERLLAAEITGHSSNRYGNAKCGR